MTTQPALGFNTHAICEARDRNVWSNRRRTTATIAASATSGCPHWNGGSGSYSSPSWMPFATASVDRRAASVRPKSIPAVTPPPDPLWMTVDLERQRLRQVRSPRDPGAEVRAKKPDDDRDEEPPTGAPRDGSSDRATNSSDDEIDDELEDGHARDLSKAGAAPRSNRV